MRGSRVCLSFFLAILFGFLRTEADSSGDDVSQTTYNATVNTNLSSCQDNNVVPISDDDNVVEEEEEEAECDSVEARWAAENLQHVLESWNFDESEEAKFMELRARLSDINHWKNGPDEVSRFIKEHNFDVDKAEKMFRGMIEWRTANEIDAFMEHYGEPPEIFHYAPIFLLKGLDKEGDPIFVQRIGKLDAWGLHQEMGEAAMLQANRFISELHTSRTTGVPKDYRWQKEYYEPLTGRRVTQFTILVDLDGLSRRLLRPALFNFLQKNARIAQDHYPGLAKRIIIVRAPRLFKMAWSVAKYFYDDRVHDKFIFTNHADYLEVLSDYMDLEVLPSVMYEHGQGQPMPGWFEKIHMEGGCIPSKHGCDGGSRNDSAAAHEEDKTPPSDTTTPPLPPPDLPSSS